jgi:hypothetical protein
MLRPSLTFTKIAHSAPPHAWFGVSAIFHYLALQLRFLRGSESMGNHDSKIVDAGSVD